jgi:hypothetical protein
MFVSRGKSGGFSTEFNGKTTELREVALFSPPFARLRPQSKPAV